MSLTDLFEMDTGRPPAGNVHDEIMEWAESRIRPFTHCPDPVPTRDEILEHIELAVTYLEDGAAASSARVLRESLAAIETRYREAHPYDK